jgi:uncharacterized protein
VLVQHQSIHEPEAGGGYTVKRYESEKKPGGDDSNDWRHKVIRLQPENPDFEPIMLIKVDECEVSVVAELLEVLR